MSIYKEFLRQGNFIGMNKPLAKAIGRDEALLFSFILDFESLREKQQKITKNGFYPVSVGDLQKESTFNKNDQLNSVKKLIAFGILEQDVIGMPATRHFRTPPNFEEIIENLISQPKNLDQLDVQDSDNQLSNLSPTSCPDFSQLDVQDSDNSYITKSIPNLSSNKKENKEKKFNAENYLENLDLDSEIKSNLKSWLEIRKTKKTPTTQTALNLNIKKLKKFPRQNQIEMIQNSIMNGWTGIFEIKQSKFDPPPKFKDPSLNQYANIKTTYI